MTTQNRLPTPRQLRILGEIAEVQNKNCYSPSMDELAERLQLSKSTVHEHIAALRRKGLLTASPGRARSLKLTSRSRNLLKSTPEPTFDSAQTLCASSDSVPLLGKVAAGRPIEAVPDRQQLPVAGFQGDDIFALQVTGDSMIEEGIFDGDYVICKKASTAENGSLVVAIVDENQATLKRFYRTAKHARLQPANSNYAPIITDKCRIEAIAVGLLRKF